jgi:ATP diphosphatase
VADAEEVLRNWDAIKRGERAARGEDVVAESALHGVPRGIPSLTQAYELSAKAAKVGFEWPVTDGFLDKVAEEAHELAAEIAAGKMAHATAELGDLLFALATLSRRLGISAEDALRGANLRFRSRFEAMEAQARAQGRALDTLTLDEWDTLWAAAKARQ